MMVAAFWFVATLVVGGGLASIILSAEFGVPRVETIDPRQA